MRRIISLIVATSMLPATMRAQASAQPKPGWVAETIHSRALGRRTVYVATPADYATSKARYPVVVLLDAEDPVEFGLWVSQAAYVTDNMPGVPQVIAVGIANGDDRLHDMLSPASGSSVARFKTAGGDVAFADFILGEVLPHIRATYRTMPSTILAGHSAGALFALDVAAHRPTAFQGIIAMSPALWYNDSSGVRQYSDLLIAAPNRPRIFVCSGGLEQDIDVTSQRLAQIMSAAVAPGTFEYRHYPDLWHAMTPMSFADGFRFIFRPVWARSLKLDSLDVANADSGSIAQTLSASERAYAAGAKALGLPEQLSERVVNSLGYKLLNANRNALAVWIFRENARRYPESVNVYDSLADGLLALGDTSAAVQELQRSIQLAKKNGEIVNRETEAKLRKLTPRKAT